MVMSKLQEAKNILCGLVGVLPKKGCSYVPSLYGSDRVIAHKVIKAFELLSECTGQSRWFEVGDGRKIPESVNLSVFRYGGVEHGIYFSKGNFFYTNDFCHGEIEGITHYMVVDIKPPK